MNKQTPDTTISFDLKWSFITTLILSVPLTVFMVVKMKDQGYIHLLFALSVLVSLPLLLARKFKDERRNLVNPKGGAKFFAWLVFALLATYPVFIVVSATDETNYLYSYRDYQMESMINNDFMFILKTGVLYSLLLLAALQIIYQGLVQYSMVEKTKAKWHYPFILYWLVMSVAYPMFYFEIPVKFYCFSPYFMVMFGWGMFLFLRLGSKLRREYDQLNIKPRYLNNEEQTQRSKTNVEVEVESKKPKQTPGI